MDGAMDMEEEGQNLLLGVREAFREEVMFEPRLAGLVGIAS